MATILSAFPDTAYARPGDLQREQYRSFDIMQRVTSTLEGKAKRKAKRAAIEQGVKGFLDEKAERAAKNIPVVQATDVTVDIISAVVTEMLSSRDDESLNFLELFRQALGQIYEQHNSQFRQFAAFIEAAGDHGLNADEDENLKIQARKFAEIRLSLEVADVIDELNMLGMLLQKQAKVLSSASKQVESVMQCEKSLLKPAELLMPLRNTLDELGKKIREDYLAQIISLTEDAERAQKDILSFLDIQQREESIREAQENARQAKENVRQTESLNRQALFSAKQVLSAQQQADATGAQNQILFIFTIVTIVFLPLSFITSYYGMNVKDAKDQQILLKSSDANKVLFASSGSITAFLLLIGSFWFLRSKKRARKDRIEELATLKKDGDLPDRLLRVGDDMFDEVEARVEEMRKLEKVKDGTA